MYRVLGTPPPMSCFSTHLQLRRSLRLNALPPLPYNSTTTSGGDGSSPEHAGSIGDSELRESVRPRSTPRRRKRAQHAPQSGTTSDESPPSPPMTRRRSAAVAAEGEAAVPTDKSSHFTTNATRPLSDSTASPDLPASEQQADCEPVAAASVVKGSLCSQTEMTSGPPGSTTRYDLRSRQLHLLVPPNQSEAAHSAPELHGDHAQPPRKRLRRCESTASDTWRSRTRAATRCTLTLDMDVAMQTAIKEHDAAMDAPVETFHILPDELVIRIFTCLDERALCRLAHTCKRFGGIANDTRIWRSLYHNHFEYDLPCFHPKFGVFQFLEPASWPRLCNPWKDSFRMLYRALHVRTNWNWTTDGSDGRNTIFNQTLQTLPAALAVVREMNASRAADAEPPLVLIHAGTHVVEQAVVVDTDVQLCGAAAGNIDHNVRVESSQPAAIVFTHESKRAYLGHLTVNCNPVLDPQQQAEADPIELNRQVATIDIHNSTPFIEHCHVRSNSEVGAALCTRGHAARPHVKHCTVKDCDNVGIFVVDYAEGFFEDCEISNTALAGVWVKSAANPVFRRCQIHNGRDVGVFCFEGGKGYFEECNIYNNRISGFEIKLQADPTVKRCEIHHGQTGGIYVHQHGLGRFIENKIHSNCYAGIWIMSGSNPTVCCNEISNGLQGGIYVLQDGQGLIERNDIHGNALAGIQIRSGSDPIVRQNRIHDGMHGGVYVHENGRGLLEQNEIYSNALAGIWITTESRPIMRKNRIHSGKQVGVYFYDNGHGVLEDCDIFNHVYSGVQIRTGSNPSIRRNRIWGGANGGILVYNGGLGTLDGNDIFDNAMAGVWIKTDSNPTLRTNRIYDGRDAGVCVFNKGKGLLVDNDIFGNAQAGVLVSTESSPVLKRNRIHDGRAAGLEVTNGATAVVEDNRIFGNRYGGICTATGVSLTLKNNDVRLNHDAVLRAVRHGQCLFRISSYTSFPMHDFYRCHTCQTTDRNAICVNCIRTCHQGHSVEFVRHDRFFCDCGADTLDPGVCRLQCSGTVAVRQERPRE